MTILGLITRVHLASFVTVLATLLKYSTFSSFFCITICTVDRCLNSYPLGFHTHFHSTGFPNRH